MDLETIQLLNLSPIPELSELELSTVLDHLSGLSDVNGDLTDRNVEDILKEAEDLLDRSTSSKTYESKDVNNNPETEENKLQLVSSYVNDMKDNEKHNVQHSDFESTQDNKHHNTPVKNDYYDSQDICVDNNDNKHHNSPVGPTTIKTYSSGDSCNHIKSAIDSLKEFSSMIEQTLSSRSSNSSSKFSQINKFDEKEIAVVGNQLNKKAVNSEPITDSITRIAESPDTSKKNICGPVNKSVKILNCFERLYQDRPVRLSANKKSKIIDKMPKTVNKKKFSKDLMNMKKNCWQGKTVVRKAVEDIKANAKTFEEINDSFLEEISQDEWDVLKFSKTNSQYSFLSNQEGTLPIKRVEKETEDKLLKQRPLISEFQNDGFKFIRSRTDEKLMLKVSEEEVDQIKDQVKKVGVFSEKIMKEGQRVTVDSVPVMGSDGEKFTLEMVKSAGIRKLEEQFSLLKHKYDYQIEKLEAENLRLREALNDRSKILASQTNANVEIFSIADVTLPTETKSHKASILGSSSPSIVKKKTVQNASLENGKAPENSPCSSLENVQPSTGRKEAFSQTEKELKSSGVQCSQESKPETERKDIGTNGSTEIISETRKTENKENLAQKKKSGKSKPFSDFNFRQMMKQKKAIDYETQLLATLRGLQAEVNGKDKENRKLKTEIDSLRRQIKKLMENKIENFRKCNTGTQTLGLGFFAQKPYNPENYEVPQELDKENEELRSRIKALEEDFELLKEKRISDLQSLHQVHEEEMTKLISKLETQSALTRHLHSLLVNPLNKKSHNFYES